MTDADRALAHRAIACKHWRWMPGMRVAIAHNAGPVFARLMSTPSNGIACADERGRAYGWYHLAYGAVSERCLPAFEDAATLGCLLALVREAWGSPLLYAVPVEGGWMVPTVGALGLPVPIGGRYAKTEAEALVLALEAAP